MPAKESIRDLLRGRGLEVGGYRHTVTARRQQMFTHFGTRTLIDVGANVGQYARAIRRAGFTRDILSFEPYTPAFSALSAAAAGDGNWRAHHFAVGDRSGSITLNVSEGSIFSSVLEISQGAIAASPNARPVGTEDVPLDTLDHLVEALSVDGPLAVKIDVQGFEREVLVGSTATLAKADIVEMELSPRGVYGGQMLMHEALTTMGDAGFVLSLVENLFPEPATARSLQFNGIFTRT